MATLQSIQVGQPTEYQAVAGDTSDKPWRTAFYKQPVQGPVSARKLGLSGDGQADPKHHGGPDKAVCVYSTDHWAHWREALAESLADPEEFAAAAFGENFSIAGWTEPDVCLGDRWRIGDAEFEVSQPRQPCWKLARRWRTKDLTLRVQQTGYTGWYLRVVREGEVAAGQPIELVERPLPEWTVARANEVMHHRKKDREATEQLAAVGLLAESWREQLQKRLE